MRTNIVLDDELVARAMAVTGARSKREVVHLALHRLVEEREPADWRELAGSVRFQAGYDWKRQRAGEPDDRR